MVQLIADKRRDVQFTDDIRKVALTIPPLLPCGSR